MFPQEVRRGSVETQLVYACSANPGEDCCLRLPRRERDPEEGPEPLPRELRSHPLRPQLA